MRTNVKKLKKINVKDYKFPRNLKEKENQLERFFLDKKPQQTTNDNQNINPSKIQKNSQKDYLKHSMNKKERPHYIIDSINPNPFTPLKTAFETNLHLDIEIDKKSYKTHKENNLVEEYDSIKKIWAEIGVTEEFQNYFEEMLENLSKDEISEILTREKKQVIQFKTDLERLNKEISKRENDIENIKNIDENYLKKQLTRDVSQIENIEKEVKDCLKLIRLHTINTIIQFNKFRLLNYFHLTSGKIDINQMKNGNIFMMDYLLRIKNDLDFLKQSNISNLYHFSESDPFFLSLLKNSNKNQYLVEDKHYKHLGATKDTLSTINDCLFILAQEELFYKLNCVNINPQIEGNSKIIEEKTEENTEENNEDNVNYNSEDFKKLKNQNENKNNNILSENKNLSESNNTASNTNTQNNFNIVKTEKINNNEDQQKQFYSNKKKSNSIKVMQVKNKSLKIKGDINLKNSIPNDKGIRKDKNFDKFSSNSTKTNRSYSRKIDNVNKNWDRFTISTNKSQKKLSNSSSTKQNKYGFNNLISQFRTRNTYDKLSFSNQKDNLPLLNNRLNDIENKGTSSEELNKNFEYYDKIREELNKNEETNKEENYKTMWYVDSAKDFKNMYEDYYDSLPLEIIYAFNLNNNQNIFFEGMQPKILVNKKISNNKIFGICAVSYIFDENKNKILKIKHLSAIEKDIDNKNYYNDKMQYKILGEFLNFLPENNVIEIDFYPNENEGNKLLFNFLVKEKMFKIFKEDKMENKIILRKNENQKSPKSNNIVLNIKKTDNIVKNNNDNVENENTDKKDKIKHNIIISNPVKNDNDKKLDNKDEQTSHQDNNNKNPKIKINLTGINSNLKNSFNNASSNSATTNTNNMATVTNASINNINNNQTSKNTKIKINLTNYIQKNENNTNQIENNNELNKIEQKNNNTNNTPSINLNLNQVINNDNQLLTNQNNNTNNIQNQNEKADNSNDVDNDIDTIILDEENVENLENNENKPPEIFYSSTSILSLIDKTQFSSSLHNIQTGKFLFKVINTFNLSLLINSLKINNAFSISNSSDEIITTPNKYISNSAKFISDQDNNCTNLKNIPLNSKLLIINRKNTNIKYSYLTTSLNCKLDIYKTVKFNNYFYHGIKIDINNNVTIVDDDIILYNVPTSDENITICLCPYNEGVEKIINKYDKNNNMFNSFNTFLNLVSLYINDVNRNITNNSEKLMWMPCFNIDTQMIVDTLPDYQNINIQSNNGNQMNIIEYNELLKVGFLPGNNLAETEGIDLSQDMVIGNNFIFCLCHKDIKNKFNFSIISLAYVTKENWIVVNK